jgi:hypothetical protein
MPGAAWPWKKIWSPVGREVAPDALEAGVRAKDHRQGVPADHPPHAKLHRLVAGESRLLLRADRVDVARLGQAREADLQLPRALEEPIQDEPSSLLAGRLDDILERVDPLARLDRIDIGQLLLELVEDVVNRSLHLAAMVAADAQRWRTGTQARRRTASPNPREMPMLGEHPIHGILQPKT